MSNGELLAAAEREGVEVFVTTDKNLGNQQNLSGLKIAIVVLSSTSWPRIQGVAMARLNKPSIAPCPAVSKKWIFRNLSYQQPQV
jgi:hypothetical protein